MLLCKDVLQHWPNQTIIDFLHRNRRRFRNALLTNDIWSVHDHAGVNADIPVGSWRPIDLEMPPFLLTLDGVTTSTSAASGPSVFCWSFGNAAIKNARLDRQLLSQCRWRVDG